MTKKYILFKYIFSIMLIILFILWLNMNKVEAAGKYDYVMIGDSGKVQMYAAVTGDWSIGSAIEKECTVNGKSVKFLGIGSIGHDYWFSNSSNYQKIKNALSNAKDGAKCLVWLGSNDLYNYSKYPGSMNTLATNYPKVNFYFISSTAINEEKYRQNYPQYADDYTNNDIKEFNNRVAEKLKQQSRYNKNLFYKDIQNTSLKIGSQTKTLYHWVTDDSRYTGDGLHYYDELNKAIWEQALTNFSGTSGGSSSGGRSIRTNIGNTDSENRNSVGFTDVLGSTDYYSNIGDLSSDESGKVESKIGAILSVITNIGIIISLIMIAILGVKYMLGSQVEAKKDIVPYLV